MSKDDDKVFDLDGLAKPEPPGPDAEVDVVPSGDGERGPSPAAVAGGSEAAAWDQLGAISDVPVQLSAVLGRAGMPVSQLLRLGRGAVVELDRKVGEPIDILVNNRLVARGEVVVVDERLGVTMTEIIKSET